MLVLVALSNAPLLFDGDHLTKVVFMPRRNGGYWSDKGYEWYGGT